MIVHQRGFWNIAQLMHGLSSEAFKKWNNPPPPHTLLPLFPSADTQGSWPRSRGLVQGEKKLDSWCVKHQRQCVIFSLKWAVWNVHLKEWEWDGGPLCLGRNWAERKMFYVCVFVRNAFFRLWLCTLIWSHASARDTHAAAARTSIHSALCGH